MHVSREEGFVGRGGTETVHDQRLVTRRKGDNNEFRCLLAWDLERMVSGVLVP